MLHINLVYLPAYRHGGPIISVHNQNKGIARCGVDVTVYTTTINGPEELSVPVGVPVEIAGVHVYYFRPTIILRRWFYSYDFHRFLAAHIHEFDIIHVTAVFTAASVLARYYARKHKKPYFISPLGSLMREPLLMKKQFLKKLYIALIERRNLQDAAAIHFTVEAEKEEYFAQGFPAKKVIIIPNSINSEDYGIPHLGLATHEERLDKFEKAKIRNGFCKKFGISEDKKLILFISRLNWKKGFDTLIPALDRVRRELPESLLLIVGGDDEKYGAIIRRLVRQYKLENHVLFTGMLLGKEKFAAFQSADVFVLPSYSENFGIAVVEAMCFEVPVIITLGVGISPSILKWKAGLVVKKEEKVFAEAIIGLLKDKARAKEMGLAGRKLVEKEFSIESVAERFVKEYEVAIGNYSA